jgi:hypothetical protein
MTIFSKTAAGCSAYRLAMTFPGHLASLPNPRRCYLEIPAADAARSAAFYEAVFEEHGEGRR